MNAPLLKLTEDLIFSIKSGRSLSSSLQEFQEKNPHFFKKNYLCLKEQNDLEIKSAMAFELSMILKRGLDGLPILKSLEDFHSRLYEKIDHLIEERTKKAPFKALIPLFLFQVPSLCLIFFYPLVCEFLNEAL
jgi:hypothetical protein